MKILKNMDVVCFAMLAVTTVIMPAIGAWLDARHSTEFLSLAKATTLGMPLSVLVSIALAIAALVAWRSYSIVSAQASGSGYSCLGTEGLAISSAAVYAL